MLNTGTHRGIFRSLKGLSLVVPVTIKRFSSNVRISHYQEEIQKSRSAGSNSVVDLAARVVRPQLSVPEGPIDVQMSLRDISLGTRYDFSEAGYIDVTTQSPR